MIFDTDGFFAPASPEELAYVEQNHGELFREARALNCVGMKMIDEVTVMNGDSRQVVFFALFLRLLSHYQACVSLAETGSAYPAKTSLRFVLEISFYCIALESDEDFYERMSEAEIVKMRDRCRAIKRYKERYEINDERYRQAVQTLDHIDGQGKKLAVRDVAEASGLLDMYDNEYVAISDAVHSSFVSLEEAMSIDRDTMRVTHMDFRRDYKDLGKTVGLSMICLADAIIATANFFGVKAPSALERTRMYLAEHGHISA